MQSINAKLRVHIGNDISYLDDEESDGQGVIITLYLPEVEREILYDSAPLEDFDSLEYVLEWIEERKGDAILLGCEFDDVGVKEVLEEIFNEYYADDFFDGDELDGDLP
jgi:hypothetical protein